MGQTCSYIFVQSGDSCGALASRCGISGAQFTQYNPGSDFCSRLMPKQPVCCSEGSLPDLKPKQNENGTCASYVVQPGEYCSIIAENHYISVADIETYNANTWGWNGCASLPQYANICLSPGEPPMPSPVENAVCGPQVPGTARPSDWSKIQSLNPCPLNACCNTWGQCGITPEFCTQSPSSTGAPGTTGCISNCGTNIVSAPSPPAEFLKVGYFEAFNAERPCLNMRADQIPAGYSHVHFSFGGITPDFAVDLSAHQAEFELFAKQTGFKRILAFGGWSFSTDGDSAPIFHDGVTDANRLAFARSVAAVVEKYNLDGVDFDWEYPGSADIAGSSPQDGANYLAFLKMVRSLLPAGKTISMAAPASFWYLRGFPIADMAPVLDYIVYMTYDLHGQWDYNSRGSQDGCPTGGDCLRSHVNLTETNYALAMLTKASVPSTKIVVGLASYGRSFKMLSPTCRSRPTCQYQGPESTASPGRCTNSRGIIAQAEIEEIIQARQQRVYSWHDAASDSDMVQYDTDSWAAYMSEGTKESRRKLYQGLNFGGSAEWAVDLIAFVAGEGGNGTSAAAAAAAVAAKASASATFVTQTVKAASTGV